MNALLLAVLRPEDDEVASFFRWYETEHVTGRMAVPGFRYAHRYVSPTDPALGLLIYELADLATLASPEYRAVQAATAEVTRQRMGRLREFVRVTGTVVQRHGAADGPAPALLVAGFTVPEDELADFDSWYRDGAGPRSVADPGCLGVRLVEVAESTTGWNRVAVHRLTGSGTPAVTHPSGDGTGHRWPATATYHVTATESLATGAD